MTETTQQFLSHYIRDVLAGPKGLAAGTFEVKKRADASRENLSPAATIDLLSR